MSGTDGKKTKPKCFPTAEQYAEWIELDAYSSLKGSPSEYCHDCLPEFKDRMLACGRCEHPETKFRLDTEGRIYGDRRDWSILAAKLTGKKRPRGKE